ETVHEGAAQADGGDGGAVDFFYAVVFAGSEEGVELAGVFVYVLADPDSVVEIGAFGAVESDETAYRIARSRRSGRFRFRRRRWSIDDQYPCVRCIVPVSRSRTA